MKFPVLCLILASFIPISGQAQLTITTESFPGAGDTLFTAIDNLPSGNYITGAGEAQSWDFTTLQAPFPRRTLLLPALQGPGSYAFPNASFYASMDANLAAYFRVSNTAVELLGFYGQDPLGLGVESAYRFTPPVIWQRAPLRYQDVNESQANLSLAFSADDLPAGVLDNLPITPDSLRIRLNIHRSDVADAWGTLTIPGGIYDVLREKRTEVRETRLDAKVGFFGWQDITDIAIQALGATQLGPQVTVSYYYFSNEAVEPIALVVANEDESQVLRVEYKANNITTNVQNAEALKPGVWAFPNPAIVNVRFEFTNLPPGQYKLKIHNILGIEEWRKSYFINGNHTEKVDISALRKGTYLYSLVDEQGKTITTRRLIVVRP
ncbi:MAG: T9SS type A sorting domain-containing protein [Phaeodactylibacter sp.]|nr:T9SS type A sorting domain-containing protein [Phaeodactylibacter sp.]MCB9266928.1 T9SS type A sorting domain-containing protein [Lewinellaceae bacterium]MCB9285726.1 T9SS type A sorting domain-containing protein [Lewinellaceae bacterium]